IRVRQDSETLFIQRRWVEFARVKLALYHAGQNIDPPVGYAEHDEVPSLFERAVASDSRDWAARLALADWLAFATPKRNRDPAFVQRTGGRRKGEQLALEVATDVHAPPDARAIAHGMRAHFLVEVGRADETIAELTAAIDGGHPEPDHLCVR